MPPAPGDRCFFWALSPGRLPLQNEEAFCARAPHVLFMFDIAHGIDRGWFDRLAFDPAVSLA